MAKKKEVIITCNATNVKAVIEGLERGMAALAREEEKLLGTIKQRGYAENDEKKRLKELEKAMDAMRTNVQKNREEQKKLAEVMDDLSRAKLKDLKKALQEGKAALNNMSARDPKRQQLVNDLKKIQAQIEANTGAIKKQQSAWGSLGTTLKNLVAYAGVFAGFNKLKSLTEDVFRSNLKLSDSLANIRKVSGLSGEAINELYRNISKIDTRNTIETLNQLAYTGAKLGIGQNYGVQGLTGFVKAAEQVQMALGEDMGEKALPELAKMTEVMGLISKYGVEQSMQKAASAIFQLGATSTATGTNIVEFSKRLYGLANVSRISTDDLLALGSASDAMGLMPEVAATAFNKMFTAIQRQHNLIEQSLGMTKGRIKELYDEGKTMDAIVEIFERMNQKGNLNLLGSIFKDLGSDGARLVNVMATMADRADILRKHLAVSRDAFKEGEAVIGEYMIQNQTAAALVERASNLWAKAFVNPEGVDMVKELATQWYELSKAMTQSDAQMASLRNSLDAIALVIETLIKLLPFLIRSMMMFGVAAAIRGVVTGFVGMVTAIRTATTAQIALNTAMKSNWFLAIASGVAAALSLLYDYSKAAEEAAEREKEREAKMKAAFESSREAVEKVVKPLEIYKRALDEANLSEKQKMELVKQFKNDYQDYLDYLGIEINSALDLAKAYAMVVKVMKQKKAYEERESYRQQQNGDNRMSRIENQAKLESQLRSMGITDIGKSWLENMMKQGKGTKDTYDTIMRKAYGTGAMEVKGTGKGRWVARDSKGNLKEVGSETLWNTINDYILSYRAERDTNRQIDQMFNLEYKDIDLEHFNIDDFNDKVQKARWKRKGSLDNEKPDKAAIAAAKKAAAERKQALRKEMQDAEKESTGIISKLEEWYRLQEAAIQDARADGQLTEEQAKKLVETLSIAKNESLSTARRAVTTGNTKEWDDMKKNFLPKMLSDTSDLSMNLLETIQKVPVDILHKNLSKFNGSMAVMNLDSRAFFDQMNAKAAGNTREAAKLRVKLFNQAEKIVKQHHFIEQATDKLQKDLETMGLITETYEQFAQRMQKGIMDKPSTVTSSGRTISDKEAFAQMGTKFIGQGLKPYSINIENKEEAQKWIHDFATNSKGELEDFAQAFPQIMEWLKLIEEQKKAIAEGDMIGAQKAADELEAAMPTIQAMFYQLEANANSIGATIRKQVEAMTSHTPIGIDEMRTQSETRVSMTESLYDEQIGQAYANGDTASAAELERQKQQAIFDIKEEFRQKEYQIREQMNATWYEQYENEVAVYQNMLNKKLISEKQFQKKKRELDINLGLKNAQFYNGQMSSMVDALQEYEISAVEAKYDVLIAEAKKNGQDTTELENKKEEEKLNVQKKYADLQFAVKASEIIANTAVAIMQAYAQLGPIGGSIAAALMSATGVLQLMIANKEREKIKNMTVGSAPSSSTSTSSSSGTSTKLRLGKGMLTYDEGNVHKYLGQDGRVYTATEETAPKDGLVTHPIATTVQGQAALVAEKGPEIVLGRKTTRAIMMNEPELIRYLANYQQHGGKYEPRRLYDSGNVDAVQGSGLMVNDQQTSDDADMRQTLATLTQTVGLLQQQLAAGIRASINMYGNDGLYEQHKKATSLMRRYGK